MSRINLRFLLVPLKLYSLLCSSLLMGCQNKMDFKIEATYYAPITNLIVQADAVGEVEPDQDIGSGTVKAIYIFQENINLNLAMNRGKVFELRHQNVTLPIIDTISPSNSIQVFLSKIGYKFDIKELRTIDTLLFGLEAGPKAVDLNNRNGVIVKKVEITKTIGGDTVISKYPIIPQ